VHKLDEGTTDMAIAGAIIHDIVKIYVYDHIFISQNEESSCVDHPTISVSLLEKYRDRTGSNKEVDTLVRDLQHIARSHHGIKDWGAIIEPNTVAAHVVFCADMSSSRPAQKLIK